MEVPRTLRVFLSYHSPDHEVARRLADSLAACDPSLDVFFDRYDLRAGAFWIPALSDAIGEADAVIVLLGARSPGQWQRLEYFEALDRKAKEPRFPIIPVLLPSATPRLPFLYQLHQLRLADSTTIGALDPLLAALRGEPAPPPEEPWRTVNPYRGLLAMTDADADFFFGRERLTTDILEQLRQGERMIALIGNSGVGKSSLVQAGVVAALRRQRWPGGGGRDWPSDLRDSRSWLVLTMKPGDAPVFELARAFVAQWTEPTDPARERLSAEWAMSLQETLGLAALMRATRDHFREGFGLPPPDRFVLIVDQAEELYTRAGEAEAHRFSEIVVAGLHDPTLTLLTSLRSDHYGHFQADAQLFANSVMVDVPPLREEGLRQVVERPPALLGAHFEDGNMGERVVNATARQPGALPLLSYLLEDLWKGMQRRADGVLRWSDYPELVGVRGVLARRAEEFFEICREGDQAVLQRLFTLRLVHVPAEGQVSSRRARREECSEGEWRLAESLAGPDWRLLVFGGSGSEVTAEVAHEVLLRDWERLSRWLEAERAFLIWKGEIEGDRREWQRTSADEGALLRGTRLTEAEAWLARRGADLVPEDRAFVEASVRAREREQAAQTRRRRWIVGSSLTVAVVLAVLLVVAGWQWQNAKNQTRIAIKNTTDFVSKAVQLSDSFGVPRSAIGELLTLAETGFKRVQESGKLPELRSAQAWLLMARADHDEITGKSKKHQLDTAERARDILQALVDYNPSNPEWQQQLAFSHDLVGDILADPKERNAALAEYSTSQQIRKKLFTDNPNDPNFERDLSISHIKIGDMLYRQGHPEKALDAFWSALDVSERLARDYPEKLEWKRDVLEINKRIGDVLTKSDRPAALDHYQRSLEIAKQLITVAPSNIQLRYDLSTSYQKVGSNLEDQRRMHEALNAYRTSLDIANELTACDPANGIFQHATALYYEDVGRVLLNQEGPQAALYHYQRSLEIRKQIADVDPSTTKLRDVFEGHNRIGELLEQGDQHQDAIAAYQASREIAQHLVDSDPESAEWRYLLYRQSGIVRQLEKDNEGARHMYCHAKNIAMMNSELNPDDHQWKKRLNWLQQRLEDLQGSGGCPV